MSHGTPGESPPRTLVEGQWLDQRAFHALYEAMPPETRAELINGVVYLPGPDRTCAWPCSGSRNRMARSVCR